MECLVKNLVLSGNGIVIIRIDNFGNIIGLDLFIGQIKVKIIDGYLVYDVEGYDKFIFVDDVIYLVGFGDDLFWGKLLL